MKRTALSAVLLSVVLPLCAAEPGFTNVIARQRWPWSPKVDIDFTVTGSNTCVKFIAQYDGVEPFTLAEKDLEGDFGFELKPGLHHVAWDPVRAGLGSTLLKNFRVTVAVDTIDRTYLILDLTDGSYTYAATVPEGGWIAADPANVRSKMVFRRIPAGTFTMGYPEDMITGTDCFKGLTDSWDTSNMRGRKMTISTDYYMAVYKTTTAQHFCATNAADGRVVDVSSKDITFQNCSYDNLRGRTNDTPRINWPTTMYDVSDGSVLAAYRRLTANTLPVSWTIDLPTSAQWERAAKADTPTNQYWSVGGKAEDSYETLTNYIEKIAVWQFSGTVTGSLNRQRVGQLLPNGWGMYDFAGVAFEWALDWKSHPESQTDPVGPVSQSSGVRTRRGAYISTSKEKIHWFTPVWIGQYEQGTDKPGYRLCIHLKQIRK